MRTVLWEQSYRSASDRTYDDDPGGLKPRALRYARLHGERVNPALELDTASAVSINN